MFKALLLVVLLLTLGFMHQNVTSARGANNWRVICLNSLNEQVPVNVEATDINDALDQAHAGSMNCTALAACNTDVLTCPDV